MRGTAAEDPIPAKRKVLAAWGSDVQTSFEKDEFIVTELASASRSAVLKVDHRFANGAMLRGSYLPAESLSEKEEEL